MIDEKFVPLATHSDDSISSRTQLFTKSSDMRIDRTCINGIFVTPNILQKNFSGESPASMLHQSGEQFEFSGGQIQSRAADGDFVVPLVHAELIHHQNRRISDGPQPSKQVLHTQNQS